MALKHRVALLLLVLVVTVLGSTPLWFKLPAPKGAEAISSVACLRGCAAQAPVTLPLSWTRRGGRAEYRLTLDLDRLPQKPLYLFIPMLSQRAVVALDGREVADTGTRALLMGVMSGVTALVPLPTDTLTTGRNTIDISLQAQGIMRGYLSRLYIGTADQLAPYYRLKIFLLEHVRLMTMSAQLLIAIAMLAAWLYHPREALFKWIFLLLAISLFTYIGLFADFDPGVHRLLPYAFILSMPVSFILQIIALLINGVEVPRWLKTCVVAVPCVCALLALLGVVPAQALVLGFGIPLMILAPLVTTAIAAWGAWVKGVAEAWLLLVPLLLFVLALAHDGGVVAGWLDGPVFLAIYYRQGLTIGVAVILARRLGISLRRLDQANAHLTQRLAEREEELARLYDEERREAAQRVRGEERQRLTADLHDGLSGHLASIIALAEREQSPVIERSAREALDDLRAVIHSLDIGDRELAAALSDLREQLGRQLKRMGIALEWSTAHLPEISGVTPTHALNVLRIVQEACTNAVKHGPANRIVVRGRPCLSSHAVIEIENDGVPLSRGSGWGLENMRRRALQLGGSVRVESLDAGVRVTLVLPERLPSLPAAGMPG